MVLAGSLWTGGSEHVAMKSSRPEHPWDEIVVWSLRNTVSRPHLSPVSWGRCPEVSHQQICLWGLWWLSLEWGITYSSEVVTGLGIKPLGAGSVAHRHGHHLSFPSLPGCAGLAAGDRCICWCAIIRVMVLLCSSRYCATAHLTTP